MNFLTDASLLAKILSQIQSGDTPIPIEIFAQAKAKEPSTDALPKFAEIYCSHKRIATLLKESHSGKMIAEWNNIISTADNAPERVEVGPALSSFVAVKDDEELVG